MSKIKHGDSDDLLKNMARHLGTSFTGEKNDNKGSKVHFNNGNKRQSTAPIKPFGSVDKNQPSNLLIRPKTDWTKKKSLDEQEMPDLMSLSSCSSDDENENGYWETDDGRRVFHDLPALLGDSSDEDRTQNKITESKNIKLAKQNPPAQMKIDDDDDDIPPLLAIDDKSLGSRFPNSNITSSMNKNPTGPIIVTNTTYEKAGMQKAVITESQGSKCSPSKKAVITPTTTAAHDIQISDVDAIAELYRKEEEEEKVAAARALKKKQKKKKEKEAKRKTEKAVIEEDEEEKKLTTQKESTNQHPVRKMSAYCRELSEAPEEFYCPISMDLMKDPVIIADGHTYERSAIEDWFRLDKQSSPKTNDYLDHLYLTPNRALKNLIQDFCISKGIDLSI